MIVDTHTHLYTEEFDADRAETVARALEAGVKKMILPNINAASVESMLSMCRQWPGVFYPLIGLHPEDVKEDYRSVLDDMKRLLDENLAAQNSTSSPTLVPFVGIGEVGLDFYWDATYKKEQLETFETQLGWAADNRLPVIIHSRAAFNELCDIMEHFRSASLTGIFHCFGGTMEEAEKLLSHEGFMLGIGGTVTYKKSTLPEVLSHVPADRIVVETDSPYLAPVPHRGQRNESAFIVDVVRKLADIYACSIDEMAALTTANAQRIFPSV